jgi:hypothetical protein
VPITPSEPLRNWDFAVYKETPVRESWMLQFRDEFFNFTNSPFFGAPFSAAVTQIHVATAGRISAAGEPRDIQFDLKLIF